MSARRGACATAASAAASANGFSSCNGCNGSAAGVARKPREPALVVDDSLQLIRERERGVLPRGARSWRRSRAFC